MIRFVLTFSLVAATLNGFAQEVIQVNPKITYEVGWWVYQDGLKITSAKVEKDPKSIGPSWLHHNGEVILTVEGEMTGTKGWVPVVASLHVAQQKPTDAANAKVTITPVIDVKSQSAYRGEVVRFRIVKKLSLPTMDWGPNSYDFQIGPFTQRIIFQCSK